MLKIFIKCFLFFTFSLFLCLGTPATIWAEETYRITEQELTQLETNLATLKSNNEKQLSELNKLSKQLIESRTLQQLTQTSLDNANKYLEAYAKEVKAKQRRLKWQRNIAYAICGGLTYAIFKYH